MSLYHHRNVNFPSLLIKRFRKGHHGQFQLSSFITTDAGKRYYSMLEKTLRARGDDKSDGSAGILDSLDICVIEDHLVHYPANGQVSKDAVGPILLDVLMKLFNERQRDDGLYYLNEPFGDFVRHPGARRWLISGEPERTGDGSTEASQAIRPMQDPTQSDNVPVSSLGPQGLRRLQPSGPLGSLPSIEKEPLDVSKPNGPKLILPNRAVASECDSGVSSSSSSSLRLILGGKAEGVSTKTKPPKLRRIDTSESFLSAPRSGQARPPSMTEIEPAATPRLLSPLGLTSSVSCATPRVGRRGPMDLGLGRASCQSGEAPSHARFRFPQPSGVSSANDSRPTSWNRPSSTLCMSDSHSPTDGAATCQSQSPMSFVDERTTTTAFPKGAVAARSMTPPPTTHPEIAFKVSTIIPGFLFLGPEPNEEGDYLELEKLGVRRVLNVALECGIEGLGESDCHEPGDHTIRQRLGFVEKYTKIPLRDFVEEVGVQGRIDQANTLLGTSFFFHFTFLSFCSCSKTCAFFF